MSKKNEITVSESTTLVTQEYSSSDWGDVAVESKDLVLPRILVQQSMSEAVKQKTAEEGDLVNTLTNQNYGKSIDLLPFYKTESIVVEKWSGRKFEFHSVVDYDGKQRPFEEEIEGVRYKNSHQYLIYCLTGLDSIPHALSFKGTSNKVGKQLVTLMYIANKAEKLPPPGKWVTFAGKTETSKAGDMYQVSSFTPSKRATQEEIQACLKWIGVLKDSNIVTAEESPSHNEEIKETRF